MADVQIAVIDQQNTQIALAVPGIQGPPGVAASAVTISGTTHTLDSGSSGRMILFTSSSDVTVTIPTSLPDGFSCLLVQMSTGQVTVSPAVGVTRHAALSATKTAYQYAAASLLKIGVEEYLLSGEVTA